MELQAKTKLNLSKFCQMNLSRSLARRVPFGLSQLYLTCLGKLYFSTHADERQLICDTVSQVFRDRLHEADLPKLLRRTFAGILTHYQEKLFLAYAPEPKVKKYLTQRLCLHGTDVLDKSLKFGRGLILVTGHFGAVEFLPGALGLNGYPAAIIVRPQTKELAASLAQRAASINLTLIVSENGKVLPAALKALRQGRILITEGDEFEMWRTNASQTLNFLGFEIPADRTLEVLHKRSGAPIVTGLVRREPGRRYSLTISPTTIPSDGQLVSRQCLHHLEQAIFQSPEQWYQWKEFGKVISALPSRPYIPAPRPYPVPAGNIVDFVHA